MFKGTCVTNQTEMKVGKLLIIHSYRLKKQISPLIEVPANKGSFIKSKHAGKLPAKLIDISGKNQQTKGKK